MFYDLSRELRKFFLFYFIRPLALLLGAAVTGTYNVLLAWWLDPLLSMGPRRRFERDIRVEYSWLFDQYHAKLLPRPKRGRRVSGFMNITLEVETLLVNFISSFDELTVTVAPLHAPHDWYSFEKAVALACGDPIGDHGKRAGMQDFRQLFEGNFDRLKAYFSRETYQPRRTAKLIQL